MTHRMRAANGAREPTTSTALSTIPSQVKPRNFITQPSPLWASILRTPQAPGSAPVHLWLMMLGGHQPAPTRKEEGWPGPHRATIGTREGLSPLRRGHWTFSSIAPACIIHKEPSTPHSICLTKRSCTPQHKPVISLRYNAHASILIIIIILYI